MLMLLFTPPQATVMNGLEGHTFLIKEHVGMLKAANNYDIYNPQSNNIILQCREPNLGLFTKILRFTDYKHFTPFDFSIFSEAGEVLLKITKGWTFLGAKVDVLDAQGQRIGHLNRKILTLKPRMEIFDKEGHSIGSLVGTFIGWNFTFTHNGSEKAIVTKKWAGLGKEMFTSADNYVVSIKEEVADNDPIRGLIFASILCIDMLFKE